MQVCNNLKFNNPSYVNHAKLPIDSLFNLMPIQSDRLDNARALQKKDDQVSKQGGISITTLVV